VKAILPICAFLAAGLIASPVFAGVGIPSVPVGLEPYPGGSFISQTKTNSEGVATFQNVKPGKYLLTVYVAGASGGVWKTANKSSRPKVVVEIKVPGQAAFKIAENESPRPQDRILFPFTIKGSDVRTFTATIQWGDGSSNT